MGRLFLFDELLAELSPDRLFVCLASLSRWESIFFSVAPILLLEEAEAAAGFPYFGLFRSVQNIPGM